MWHEYVKRGLLNEANDWYKYFKCSAIDPTCLPGEVINEVRRAGFADYCLQAAALSGADIPAFAAFSSLHAGARRGLSHHQTVSGQEKGATKAEVLSRAVEHGELKDAAALLTQLTDDRLDHVLAESRAERLRIQREAENYAPRVRLTASMQSRRTLTLTLSLLRRERGTFGGTVSGSPNRIRDRCVPAFLSPLGAGRGSR